jgi:branched-chain amino acid transport system substrate-binding protein
MKRHGQVSRHLVLTLLACLGSNSALAQSAADVVVAVPAPLGEAHARIGLSVHTAAQLIAAEINATGGINGATLVIAIKDDPCSSSDATSLSPELATDNTIAAVIGHPCASSARAAASMYAKSGRLFLAAGPVTPLLVKATSGTLMFQLPGLATSQATYLGQVIAAAAASSDAKIALVRDKTQSAVGNASAIELSLRASGHPPSTLEIFAGGDKGFAGLAARLAAAKVTHVALLAFPVEAGPIARELAAAIPEIKLYGADALATDDLPALAGPGTTRLHVALQADIKTLIKADPRAAALANRMRNVGINPTREAIYTAAALQAWALAARAAGSVDPITVATQLRSETGFDTLLGTIQFNASGNAQSPTWALYRWVNGQLEPE